MKILGKNVVIATKKMCMEYTSKAQCNFDNSVIEYNVYKGKNLEKNVIFVKDKNWYYVELEDLKSFPTLSLICFGAAPRWRTSPNKAGDEYIDDIKPCFDSKVNQERLWDIKTIIKIITIEKKIEMEKQEILIK